MEEFAFQNQKRAMNERRAGAERGSGPADQQRLTRLLLEDEKGKERIEL